MIPLSAQILQQHIAHFQQHGYCILERAIDEDFRLEICAELEWLQQVRPGGDIPPAPFTGRATRRWYDLLNDGDVWQRVPVHPWVLQVLQHALGDGFLLSGMGSAVVGDGEPAQPIHRDDGIYAFPHPHPNLVCAAIWALSDFTDDTGATRVVPGSHRWDADPNPSVEYETIPLIMPAGSIAVVHGSCYHGAGHNRSGRDRDAMNLFYCNGCMRQQENFMLSIHPARMMRFSTELQDILGFKMCRGAGHIFVEDPRREMNRHYATQSDDDPYLKIRNELHSERITAKKLRPPGTW